MTQSERIVKFGWSAAEIKTALRTHHPGERNGNFVGRWTCIEEWCGIDLLALDAWADAAVVGYEVKVSRADLRSELLNPTKRMEAVSRCTQFYFAVPAGLLTPKELAFVEPDWSLEDFDREPCTNSICRARHPRRGFARRHPKPRGSVLRGTNGEGVTIHLGYDTDRGVDSHGSTYTHGYEIKACCPICKGYGHAEKSRVELEAPVMLWVPKDVGLVEISRTGVSVVRSAPKNKTPNPIIGSYRGNIDAATMSRVNRQAINDFARWISNRPDPRHR